MIPRRAIFFWEGPEMSWLRKQSIASFRVLNPSWEVVVIDGSGIPIQSNSPFESVLRSDWARYRDLATNGGVYFDTDIVFCKQIPDSWLAQDLLLTMSDTQIVHHIAVMGSSKGNKWFSLLDEACERSYQPGHVYNYQFFGIELVTRMTFGLKGLDTCWIPPEAFLPIPWDITHHLWRDDSQLSPLVYGVHWYGGDRLSMSLEPRVDLEYVTHSKSLVALAWRKSLGSQ